MARTLNVTWSSHVAEDVHNYHGIYLGSMITKERVAEMIFAVAQNPQDEEALRILVLLAENFKKGLTEIEVSHYQKNEDSFVGTSTHI